MSKTGHEMTIYNHPYAEVLGEHHSRDDKVKWIERHRKICRAKYHAAGECARRSWKRHVRSVEAVNKECRPETAL